MNPLRTLPILALLGAVAACGAPAGSPLASPGGALSVVLVTHDSFAVSDDVLATFERETGASVEVLRAGDAGAMVNQAILTRDAPLGDVLFGVDNTFLSRALDGQIFEAYVPEAAASIPDELRLDVEGRVTPIDYGDVCVNYDRSAYPAGDEPRTLADLANPRHRGQLVVENPATSSPGLAFMLATIARYGETGDYTWLDYWAGLRENGVLVENDWENAYYSRFSGGAGEGDRPLVVSYATSPVAEVAFADPQPDEPPTGVLTDGCFRQVEFAGLLRGAPHADLGRELIEFMLSPEFQADIPLNMFVFPARPDAQPPDVFVEHAVRVDAPLTLDPATIAANRERWLAEWTDVVLR